MLYSKAKLACCSRDLLTSHFCIPVTYGEKDFFFLDVSSRKSCRFIKLVSFSFFSISGWDIDLDCCDVEWFCLGNKPVSLCRFWDCTQVLHFGLLLTTSVTPVLLRDMNLSKLWEIVEDRGAWTAAVHRITRIGHDLMTKQRLQQNKIGWDKN